MAEITSPIPFADPSWHQDKTNPYYKDSHRTLQKFIRNYVDTQIAPNVAQWEKQGFVPEENFKKHVSLGFLAAAVFPLPIDQLAGIKLPAGINASGNYVFPMLKSMACRKLMWRQNGMNSTIPL